MEDLFEANSRQIIRDSGREIQIATFPLTKAYSNDEMLKLSGKYDVNSHPGWVLNSLGSANTENYAAGLFKAYSFVGRFCGFELDELEILGEQTRRGSHHPARLQSQGNLRMSKIEGIEVLFPTEKFLINQQLEKRE